MPLERLKRHAEAALEVPRDLLLGRYPEFVTGGPLPRGHVPVFVFHKLEPADFGRKLRYLVDNGYVTLSVDEYFQFLVGGRPAPDKAVVLSFDDGWSSVRSVGLPLLRRHGMKGVVFVVPGRTVSRPGPLPPTWDDVREGSAKGEALRARDEGEDGFLTWEEIEDLSRSGLFDFQSHSLSHARVHVAPNLSGFLAPGMRRGYGPLDVPLVREGDGDLFAARVPLGTPLLRSQPRLSEALRFYEDPRLREACVARVAEEGEGFFYRKGWERELRRLTRALHVNGRYETPEEREAAIRRELQESRRLLEERLGKPAHHICYPWHVAGPTARRVAREVGYRTAFCGKVTGTPITLAGGDPHAIARIGEDYVERLPGRGRRELIDILRQKLARRLGAAASGS
jgi:peptidoglycan/xylan/chitin deacetylase (PgdA/CDA1 family)